MLSQNAQSAVPRVHVVKKKKFLPIPSRKVRRVEEDIKSSILLNFICRTSLHYKYILLLALLEGEHVYKNTKKLLIRNAQKYLNHLHKRRLDIYKVIKKIKVGDLHPYGYNKVLIPYSNKAVRYLPAIIPPPEEYLYNIARIFNIESLFVPYKVESSQEKQTRYIQLTQKVIHQTTIKDYRNFFYFYGKLLAFAAFIGIADLISENIVIQEDMPLVIDYEVFFDPVILRKNRLYESALYPPVPTYRNITPLQYGGFLYLKDSYSLFKINSKYHALKKGKFTLLPNILTEPHTNYLQQLISGIRDMFSKIKKHYSSFLLFLTQNSPVLRVILHSTRTYYSYLYYHHKYYPNGSLLFRAKIFSEMNRDWLTFIGIYNSIKITEDIMREALYSYYIPIFWYHKNHIYSASGKYWPLKYNFHKWLITRYQHLNLSSLEEQLVEMVIAYS